MASFGSQPAQVAQARSWCRKGVRLDPLRALRVDLIASELVTNALLHSASGSECGRVRISMQHLSDRLIQLAVTDDGPRPGQSATLPYLPPQADALATCGRGLRLVDRLSTRWGWDGEPGKPLTVWAHLAPYAPLPDTAEL